MNLPAKKPRRRNETRDLVEPIVVAVNKVPGARIFRPIVLNKLARSMSGAGLSIGSADLVGLVNTGKSVVGRSGEVLGFTRDYARFFALEVKWPGKKPNEDQTRWASMVRDLGGFCAVVHSVDEALDAVARCRRGEYL
jgi:hypothetical protein